MREHWWSINYSVFKVGGSATLYFKKRGDAESFARRQAHHGGGDWVVWKHGPFNYAKKILTVGGYFDDWPDYDPEEDY